MKEQILKILKEKKLNISFVESCTGGGLAKDFVLMPTASEAFRGSLVAYQDFTKKNLLGVLEKTLKEHTSVSSKCAKEMAKNGAELFQSDYCLITTGYAGPGGGTDADPPGTVYFALCGKKSELVERRTFKESNGREAVINDAIIFAWEFLYKALKAEH